MAIEEDQLKKLEDIHKELQKMSGSVRSTGQGMFGSVKNASDDLSNSLFNVAKKASPAGLAISKLTKSAGMAASVLVGIGGFAWSQLRSYLEETTESYRSLLDVGQSLGGSMVNLNIAAAQANMSVSDFSRLANRAGGAMAYLGTEVFAELSSKVRAASFNFGDFGHTTEELNEIFATQIETRRLMGIRDDLDAHTAQQNFIALNKSMLELSAATGKSRKELLTLAEQTKRDDFNIRAAQRALAQLPNEVRQSFNRSIEFFSATMGETGSGVSAAIAGALLDDPVSMYNQLKSTFGKFGPAIAGEIQTLASHIRDGTMSTEQASIQARRIVEATGISERDLRMIANSSSEIASEAKAIIEMTDSLRAFQEQQAEAIRRAAEAGYFDQITQTSLTFRRQLSEVMNTIRLVAFEILKPTFTAIGDAFGTPGDGRGITGWADSIKSWVNKPETQQSIQRFGEHIAEVVSNILPSTIDIFGKIRELGIGMASWLGVLTESGELNKDFFNDLADNLKFFGSSILNVVAGLLKAVDSLVFWKDIFDDTMIQDVQDRADIIKFGSLEARDKFQETDASVRKIGQMPSRMGETSPLARSVVSEVNDIVELFMEDKQIDAQERKRLIELMESNVVASNAVRQAIEKQTNISADQVEDLLRSSKRIEHHSKNTSEQAEIGFD